MIIKNTNTLKINNKSRLLKESKFKSRSGEIKARSN